MYIFDNDSHEYKTRMIFGLWIKSCQSTYFIRKVEGLITYSTDQQIFKFKVNSWGVNIEFTLYELKCTIDAILQHMGFYPTTENPCVMMRENYKPKSCEYVILHQDELYIASSTLQEILLIVKGKYKIKINSNVYQGSNFPYDPRGTIIC